MKLNLEPGSGSFRDWYLRDWKKEEHTVNGRRKVDWVYHGAYYDLPSDAPRLQLKVTAAVTTLLLIAVFLFISLCPAQAVSTPYVGYPFIFNAPVLIYYSIGVFWYCATTGPMTYRRLHACVQRMKISGFIGLVLSALTILTDFFFIVTHLGRISLLWELIYFAGVVICTAQYLCGCILLNRYPVEAIGIRE